MAEEKSGDSRERVRRFTFDYCFSEDATQTDVCPFYYLLIISQWKNNNISIITYPVKDLKNRVTEKNFQYTGEGETRAPLTFMEGTSFKLVPAKYPQKKSKETGNSGQSNWLVLNDSHESNYQFHLWQHRRFSKNNLFNLSKSAIKTNGPCKYHS